MWLRPVSQSTNRTNACGLSYIIQQRHYKKAVRHDPGRQVSQPTKPNQINAKRERSNPVRYLEHLVGRWLDPRHHVGRGVRHLLHLFFGRFVGPIDLNLTVHRELAFGRGWFQWLIRRGLLVGWGQYSVKMTYVGGGRYQYDR